MYIIKNILFLIMYILHIRDRDNLALIVFLTQHLFVDNKMLTVQRFKKVRQMKY